MNKSNKNLRKILLTVIVALGAGAVGSGAFAGLLGVLPGFPVIAYDSTGVFVYSAGSDLLTLTAAPISLRLSPSSPPRFINPTGSPASEVVSIMVQVDATGAVISGVPGDDLKIVGQVDVDGNGSIDYAGTLLTGEILGFGFLDSGTATDQYDFRFKLTGGLLASYFTGKDIGVTVTSEHSTFVSDFTLNFDGGAKGNVGPIDRLNHPPECVANGPYTTECAGSVTTIALDGSQSVDPDFDLLVYSWSTDCPNATISDSDNPLATLSIDTSASCNVDCTVTLTVSDGFAAPVSCTAAVHVSDSNAPIISCPANVEQECSASIDPANTGSATATDECDSNPQVAYSDQEAVGSCPQNRVITRTWTATDRCGNHASCDQTITLADHLAPVLTCPANIEVLCEQGTDPSVTGQATAHDDCDPAPSVTYSDVSNAGCCPIVSTIQRTWTATDACGNSVSCVQTIRIRDARAPVLHCPPDITIGCKESTRPSHTGYATATDGCDQHPTITYCDSACGRCPKIIRRTWKAMDDCGRSATCVQTITVQDITPPVITCPPDVTLTCGESTDPCKTGRARATDDCDSCVSVAYCDTATGNCPRTITRTWKATDDCGNMSTCVQTIQLNPAQFCPRSPGYWKNHRSNWPVNSLEIGGVVYDDRKLMNLLRGNAPNGSACNADASVNLAKFVISATFDILAGSDPQDIEPILDQANALLADDRPGSNPRGQVRRSMLSLADALDRYVNSSPPGCRSCGD